ncbi:S1 RNA-binding domain-containing protein [Luteitalea sp.]|uniref:30S ribosomal protein S1 n=1 Tax=Luteitalea sp. TaxID=2004800 RepID=UPI0025BE4AC8|nr:S1 RNA-binding domain-containing protein [Luteitalea sp.]
MTEPDDFHPEDDFAALFEASTRATSLKKGQPVEGTIVGIGAEVALIDVGSKSEAVLDVAELKDDDGVLEVAVGDRIQAVVVDTVGGLKLSRKLARKAATDKEVEDAYLSRLPVEGSVTAVIKGGYEVKIARSRAFCPFSQIDLFRTETPEVHVGQTYTFRITEFKDGGRSIVVSRRVILDEEQQARAEEVRRTVVPGAILTGRVVSVPAFGAFVDLGGGVQGLVHVSEIGWSRVADASEALKAGDEITVKVLRVDEATQKIALGLKQLAEDPWTKVASAYEVGQVRPGRVTRLAEFGAFVELEPGVEGLAHASTFPASGQRDAWRRTIKAGMTGVFQILSVDPDKKRIGVTLMPDGTTAAGLAEEAADQAAATARATVTQVAGFGSLGDKLRDALKGR